MCMSVGSLRCWLSGLLLVCLCWLCVCRLSDSVCMSGFYIYICIHVCVHVVLYIYICRQDGPKSSPAAPRGAQDSFQDRFGWFCVCRAGGSSWVCLLVVVLVCALLVRWFVGSLVCWLVACWLCGLLVVFVACLKLHVCISIYIYMYLCIQACCDVDIRHRALRHDSGVQ